MRKITVSFVADVDNDQDAQAIVDRFAEMYSGFPVTVTPGQWVEPVTALVSDITTARIEPFAADPATGAEATDKPSVSTDDIPAAS